jgi:hypothetical protein
MKTETKVFTVAVQFGYSHKEMVGLMKLDFEDDFSVEAQDERFEAVLEEYDFEELQAQIQGLLQREFIHKAIVVRWAEVKTIL